MKYETFEELQAKYPGQIVFISQPSQGTRTCRACWRLLEAYSVTCFRIYRNWEDYTPVKFYQCTSQTACDIYKLEQRRLEKEVQSFRQAVKT